MKLVENTEEQANALLNLKIEVISRKSTAKGRVWIFLGVNISV